MKKLNIPMQVSDYLVLTGAVLCMILSVHLFQLPNHFVFGGVTGIAILLSAVTGGSFALYNILINLCLIIIGFLALGKRFGAKTVYVTLLSSFGMKALDILLPIQQPITNQPILEMCIMTVTYASAVAVMFQKGACSGGTDIAAMILKKHVKIDIGKALVLVDFTAVMFSFVIYGPTIGLFSLVGLFTRSFVIDTFIENFNLCKCFMIVCENPDDICSYIRDKLERGTTVYYAEGGYTHQGKAVIMTAVKRNQAFNLRNYIRTNDPSAFLVITNSSEIVGKGFLLQ